MLWIVSERSKVGIVMRTYLPKRFQIAVHDVLHYLAVAYQQPVKFLDGFYALVERHFLADHLLLSVFLHKTYIVKRIAC